MKFLQKIISVLAFFLVLFSTHAVAQTAQWQKMSGNKNATFYDVKRDFYNKWRGKLREMAREEARARRRGANAAVTEEKEEGGYEVFKRWEAYMAPRVYPSGNMALPSNNYANFLSWQQNNSRNRQRPVAGNSVLSTGNWSLIGPIGSPAGPIPPYTGPYTRTGAGRVNFIRFDPNNTNIWYIGAPDGGLWKTTNGGTSWTTNTDFLGVIGCSDLAIDPTNSQIMYLATGDIERAKNSIGILKSTDGGATWNTTGLDLQVEFGVRISKLLMNPSDPLNMMVSTNIGVIRTTDGWATKSDGVFPTPNPDLKDMELKPGDPNTVYAAGKKFFKSTDNGVNWTEITTGLPTSGVERIALGVAPGNSAYVYALIAKSSNSSFLGMYRSTNSGTSFSLRASTPNLMGYEADGSDVNAGQGFYDLAIAVSPANPDIVTTGGVSHWQSADGGTTWTNLDTYATGEVHADVHEINYLPGSSTTIFSCNDGGIFKSTDNANHWNDISSNLVISQNIGIGLSATSATTIVNGTQDNGTNLTTGSNWFNIGGGDGGECFIDPTNNNTVYTQYVNGAFGRTDDGGANVIDITTGLPTPLNQNFDFYSTWIMDPVNTSRLYVGGIPTLYTSANKGGLWTALGTPPGTGSIKGIAVAPSNTTIIYIIKDDAVSKSTNSGTSFSNITGTLPVANAALSSVTVSNTDPNKVWVTFSGYSAGEKVFKSTNGGTSWTNVSTGLPNLPINKVIYTNNTLNDAIYVGADIGVYYLDNSLASFAPFMTALPNVAVRDLEIFYPTGKLRAGTFGRGVWQSDLNTTTNFALSISCAGTNNNCNAGTAGTAAVTVLTGNAPYTYLWSNGSTSASLTGLAAGAYSVTVTDANLATSTCTYTVTQPSAIVVNCSGTNATTIGGSDGTASVAPASGGTSSAPFISTNNFPGAPFNINGPLATVSTVIVPALPAGAIITSATLTLTSFNAISPSWQSDSRVSLTGAYSLASTQISLVDGSGTISPNPVINLPGFPTGGGTVNLAFSETSDEAGTDATVGGAVITINYTKNGYTYLWSNGNTTTAISGLVAGTYTITVTDVLGCTNSCAYTVTEPGGPHTITASAGANGSISPSGAVSVANGANQTFNITANSCYAIADVLVDGVSQGAIGTYTFTNVTAAHIISATFSEITYSIAASAGANGSISPNGATVVNCGANQTFNITANSCYVIADVLVDGVSQGAIGTYTFTNVTAAHTISASFSQLTFNITSSAGANGSISPTGVTSVNCGANQTYTITPAGGFNVQDVIVDGVSQGAITTYTFSNVTATHIISATFVSGAFTITATAGANGTISPSGAVSVTRGANQTFSIAANSCYQIADVLVDGVSQGAVATYTFTNVTANHTISATFSQLTYTITASAGANGSISPNGATVVNCGANQTFTITPAACYAIADVLVDGVSQGAIGTYTFTNVTAAHTISATFSQITYTITASAGANGSISPNGATVVNCGANQSYTITPNGGYNVQDVLVDGVSQGAISTYTFTNVTATHTISASFIIIVGCSPNTWTGTTNTLWSVPTNWDCGIVPTTGANVTIPDVANDPVLDANITVGNIAIATGATVSIGSNTLTINGAASGTGTLSGTATSNLVTGATTTVRFTTGANILKTLNVTVGTTTLGNALDITAGLSAGNAGTVTVSSGAVLASAGNLTFKSNEFGTARLAAGAIAGNYVTGDVTVERYIPNPGFRSWRLLSVPTSGTQTIRQSWQEGQSPLAIPQAPFQNYGTQVTGIGNLAIAQAAGFDNVSNSASLLRYNGSAWEGVTNTNTSIANQKSYFVYVRGERSQGVTGATTSSSITTLRTTGTLFTGNQVYTVSPTSMAVPFGVVGNLYVSAIDFTALPHGANIKDVFYIYDSKKKVGANLGYYTTFSGTNGWVAATNPVGVQSTTPGSYGGQNKKIESGQAFMVEVSALGNTATNQITLTEASKIASGTNLGLRPTTPASDLVKIDSRLFNAANDLVDANVVVFNDSYSNSVGHEDASKMANPSENFAVQKEGKAIAIEGRQLITANDTIWFKIWNLEQQAYKFDFVPQNLSTSGLSAVLEDSYLSTRTAVDMSSATNTVNFTVDANPASFAADRFRLVFRPASPLPVNFISISAIRTSTGVQVDWKVAAERNIRMYEVERSANGRDFSTAGNKAAAGNSAAELNYGWLDASAPAITLYYRIKCIGISGEVKYTSIVKVAAGNVKPGFTISPNPVEESVVNIQFINQAEGKYSIRLLNSIGQAVFSNVAIHAGGNSVQVLNLPATIASGTYQVEIIAPDQSRTINTLLINSNK